MPRIVIPYDVVKPRANHTDKKETVWMRRDGVPFRESKVYEEIINDQQRALDAFSLLMNGASVVYLNKMNFDQKGRMDAVSLMAKSFLGYVAGVCDFSCPRHGGISVDDIIGQNEYSETLLKLLNAIPLNCDRLSDNFVSLSFPELDGEMHAYIHEDENEDARKVFDLDVAILRDLCSYIDNIIIYSDRIKNIAVKIKMSEDVYFTGYTKYTDASSKLNSTNKTELAIAEGRENLIRLYPHLQSKKVQEIERLITDHSDSYAIDMVLRRAKPVRLILFEHSYFAYIDSDFNITKEEPKLEYMAGVDTLRQIPQLLSECFADEGGNVELRWERNDGVIQSVLNFATNTKIKSETSIIYRGVEPVGEDGWRMKLEIKTVATTM